MSAPAPAPTPLPCPDCGKTPTPRREYAWVVACDDCYDGATDAGPQLFGCAVAHRRVTWEEARVAAIREWNEKVREATGFDEEGYYV